MFLQNTQHHQQQAHQQHQHHMHTPLTVGGGGPAHQHHHMNPGSPNSFPVSEIHLSVLSASNCTCCCKTYLAQTFRQRALFEHWHLSAVDLFILAVKAQFESVPSPRSHLFAVIFRIHQHLLIVSISPRQRAFLTSVKANFPTCSLFQRRPEALQISRTNESCFMISCCLSQRIDSSFIFLEDSRLSSCTKTKQSHALCSNCPMTSSF